MLTRSGGTEAGRASATSPCCSQPSASSRQPSRAACCTRASTRWRQPIFSTWYATILSLTGTSGWGSWPCWLSSVSIRVGSTPGPKSSNASSWASPLAESARRRQPSSSSSISAPGPADEPLSRPRGSGVQPGEQLALRVPERGPEPRGRQRHVEMRDPERGQRVDGGVDDGGRDADAAGLAHALGPERVARRGRAGLLDQDVRHLVGARNRVVHERAGQELAVTVVDHRLEERLPQPLGEAAVKLALGKERVDHGARVVHPHQPLYDELPGLRL